MVLAEEKIESFDPINIGIGKEYSINDVLQTALEVYGFIDADVAYDSSKPAMIEIRLIDKKKAEKVLDFKAKTDLEDGIRKTIEWYKAMKGAQKR